MAHVLLVVDRDAVRQGRAKLVGDHAPVGRLALHDQVRDRVFEAGLGQEVGVEGLVDDVAVGAVLEGAHHRGGDVAGPGPHGDAGDGHGFSRPGSRGSASTRSRYAAWSRAVTGAGKGPGRVLPSTLPTLTAPAKVPVTKASSAA